MPIKIVLYGWKAAKGGAGCPNSTALPAHRPGSDASCPGHPVWAALCREKASRRPKGTKCFPTLRRSSSAARSSHRSPARDPQQEPNAPQHLLGSPGARSHLAHALSALGIPEDRDRSSMVSCARRAFRRPRLGQACGWDLRRIFIFKPKFILFI